MTEAEKHAKLIREMIDQDPWRDKPDARVALAIAARAVLRGRHLTEAEKLRNLANAMETDAVDDGLDMKPVADRLRIEADKLDASGERSR